MVQTLRVADARGWHPLDERCARCREMVSGEPFGPWVVARSKVLAALRANLAEVQHRTGHNVWRKASARVIQTGQAIVEFALVVPILLLMLLGIAAVGIYELGAIEQASASSTIAQWEAANPSAQPSAQDTYAASVTSCPVTRAYAPHLVTVTVECPSIAGELVPALPKTIKTTAEAYQ